MKATIRKIFEDKDILVIDKPPNVLSIPDRHDASLFNIYHYFLKNYPNIKIVHRLDFDTSGVMLLAKHASSHKSLNQQFQNHNIIKSYKALVHGIPACRKGNIDAALEYSPKGKSLVVPHGKSSTTYYEIEEEFKYYALLKVIPRTGRTHQIRVHLKYLGHPIVGDAKYGGKPFYLSSIKRNYRVTDTEKPLLSRAALHASSIEFNHPSDFKKYRFEAALPRDLRAALHQLRKLMTSG